MFDDGTMQENVQELGDAVVGHRITRVEQTGSALSLTLDDGRKVDLYDTDCCCAYTELEAFLLNLERVNHIITGVKATDDYTTWHVYADMGDVLALTVGWNAGSGNYGYGFNIRVTEENA